MIYVASKRQFSDKKTTIVSQPMLYITQIVNTNKVFETPLLYNKYRDILHNLRYPKEYIRPI